MFLRHADINIAHETRFDVQKSRGPNKVPQVFRVRIRRVKLGEKGEMQEMLRTDRERGELVQEQVVQSSCKDQRSGE